MNDLPIESGDGGGGQAAAQNSQPQQPDRPETRLFNGHEFELKVTCDNKNRAKWEAKKCLKRGFHTRVV